MSLNRLLIYILLFLVLSGGALVILQIWGVDLGELFFKLLATIGVLILVIGLTLVIKADFSEHKRLKDNDFID